MEKSELLNDYLKVSAAKSGLLMTAGKCVYLYNNICCEAACRCVLLRSERTEILAEYADELLVYRGGSNITAYRNGRRVLKLNEVIILYEISLGEEGLCGVFAYEKGARLMDAHFTDARISDFIKSLIIGEHQAEPAMNKELKKLEEAVRKGEISALNKIYVDGKDIGRVLKKK